MQTKAKKETMPTDTERLEPVTVRLPAAERTALRREAMRRVETGQAGRIDVSAIIREAISAWRGQRDGAREPQPLALVAVVAPVAADLGGGGPTHRMPLLAYQERELAAKANVHPKTLHKALGGGKVMPMQSERIRQALRDAGLEHMIPACPAET